MFGFDLSHTSFNPAETSVSSETVADLAPRWQAEIGTNGTPPFVAPTVANGIVYVGSSVSSGDNFFAFDAVIGKLLWSVDLGHCTDCFEGGLGSTAAASDSVVVVGGGDSAYYGLDATTGEVLWRHPMNVGDSGYAWASPLIAFGRAYLGIASAYDNPPVRGELRAVDLFSGEVVANQYFVPENQIGAGIWNSPSLSPDGATLVVATGEDSGGYDGPYNRAIVSLDPMTLEIFDAHKEGEADQDLDFGTTPVIFRDEANRVLVGANQKDGNFYAYDLYNLNAGAIWERPTGVIVGVMPAYDPTPGNGGTLFIAGTTGGDDFNAANGVLYAVDPSTGSDRWPPVKLGFVTGNLAIASGNIFVNVGGVVQVISERTGQILRTLEPAGAGGAYSGVVVANGYVYFLSGSYLNAWTIPGATGASVHAHSAARPAGKPPAPPPIPSWPGSRRGKSHRKVS